MKAALQPNNFLFFFISHVLKLQVGAGITFYLILFSLFQVQHGTEEQAGQGPIKNFLLHKRKHWAVNLR
jgi:hypothetical protein